MSPRLLLAPLAFALTLLFVGCEGSPYPLSDPPSIAADTSYAGWWVFVEEEPQAPAERMLVLPFNRNEFYVEYLSRSFKDAAAFDTLRARVFLTEIRGKLMANVQGLAVGDDDEYLFLQVERSGDRMVLTPVDDALYEEFASLSSPGQVFDRLVRAIDEGLETGDSATLLRVR